MGQFLEVSIAGLKIFWIRTSKLHVGISFT